MSRLYPSWVLADMEEFRKPSERESNGLVDASGVSRATLDGHDLTLAVPVSAEADNIQ